MDTNSTTRMDALYHTLFEIYDSLIALAANLVSIHETYVSNNMRGPISSPDLANLLAALSLPAAPRTQQRNVDDPRTQFALLFERFGVCTRNVKRAVRTYAELKIAVAGATNEVIIGTWVALETAAQSVGELYEILNAIIYEISFD